MASDETQGPPHPSDNNGEAKGSASTTSSFDFAGWGSAEQISDIKPEPMHHLDSAPAHRLGQWSATAICGNDITSSCLYVSAIVAGQAGGWSFICLALVWVLLLLFRNVYGEVGTALPLNGGAYNVLLNTTRKSQASIAACLTVLSYVATAVISAGEAMHYAGNLVHLIHDHVILSTIILLGIFALLNVVGISESAKVALGIFVFHMLTLVMLCGAAVVHTMRNGLDLFKANWSRPLPQGRSIAQAVFFGFSSGLLGVSGFESSANFIEEQEDGVFVKTLRNMWIATIFNPIISFLGLCVLSLEVIPKRSEDLLAYMGSQVQGRFLEVWVSIDAVLVLSGAVLTSYVGVTGLMRRMTLDRVLPQYLLTDNKRFGTNHVIIVGFFLLCVSITLVTRGDVAKLAGVYTISFLGVMTLFGLGNMALKVKRDRLPRDVRASWAVAIVAVLGVAVGMVGNILLDYQRPEIDARGDYVKTFSVYAGIALLAVAVMFYRIHILKVVLHIARKIAGKMDEITAFKVVYFTRGDDLAVLNRACQYVLENEQTKRLKVVHVYQDEADIPEQLAEHLTTLDKVYPQLRIDFVAVKGEFTPEFIEALSKRLDVPKNYMFIGTPSDKFPHRIAELGGVRLIM